MTDNDNYVRSISDIQNYIFGGESKFNSEIKKAIFKMLSAYDADGIILYQTNLEILNIEINKIGGCNLTDQHKIIYKYISKLADHFNLPDHKLIKFKINNYKSKNNNCGLVCLIRATGNKANKIKPDMIRKKYNIPLNTMITVDQIVMIGKKEFDVKVHVFNQYEYLLSDNNDNDDSKDEIFLLLKDEHYFHIDTKMYKRYRKCEICNKTLRSNNINHKCNIDNIEYFNSQIKKDSKFLI